MFDWEGFEVAMLESLLAAAATEGGPHHAVALSDLYAEVDGVIEAPMLGLNTDGRDMDSPPDWEFFVDDWAPGEWLDALTAEANSSSVEYWHATFARYQDVLAEVCRRAGARLGIPVFYLDDNRHEELLGRCLTPEQLDDLFPEIGAARAEESRVQTLPLNERLAYYLDRQDDEALRTLDAAAIPALLPLLRKPDRAWWAAKLLAEIGIADEAVIAALSAAVADSALDSPDQLWTCRALARLDRLDLVLDKVSTLSSGAIATAVAARYTAFRNIGVRPLPLDYSPLEDFLTKQPTMADKVADELAPGRSYCVITAAEVSEAMRGAASTHVVVRKHAVNVLGERALGEAVGRQVIPQLLDIAHNDPDDDVRWLAALSLRRWKVDD